MSIPNAPSSNGPNSMLDHMITGISNEDNTDNTKMKVLLTRGNNTTFETSFDLHGKMIRDGTLSSDRIKYHEGGTANSHEFIVWGTHGLDALLQTSDGQENYFACPFTAPPHIAVCTVDKIDDDIGNEYDNPNIITLTKDEVKIDYHGNEDDSDSVNGMHIIAFGYTGS